MALRAWPSLLARQCPWPAASWSRCPARHDFSASRRVCSDDNDEDASQAERVTWLQAFEAHLQKSPSPSLPRDWLSTNFSRSSGPGGQNVNKLNTKAEVRLDLASAASKAQGDLPAMPKLVARYLVAHSPYYVASSHALLISSMKTRTQSGNLQDAMAKMQSHLQAVLAEGIRGETSEEQQRRVKSLIQRDKAKTRKVKEKRGSVKSGRRVSTSSIDF